VGKLIGLDTARKRLRKKVVRSVAKKIASRAGPVLGVALTTVEVLKAAKAAHGIYKAREAAKVNERYMEMNYGDPELAGMTRRRKQREKEHEVYKKEKYQKYKAWDK